MRRLVRIPVVLVPLLAAAACASVQADAPVAPESPPTSVTAAPVARTFRLEPRDGGWTLSELFDQIHRKTGTWILFDRTKAVFQQSKLTVCGTHSIHVDELFDWLQAVLSYRKLALVPVGPKDADGKPQWFVMDFSDDGRS